MAERNVSENAKRGAIDGRTTEGRTEEGRRQTDGGSGGGILPSILPRPRSLARSSRSPQARSTCEVEAKQGGKEGRKEGAKKSELPPCCLSIVAGGAAAAAEEEEEEDKWTCPRRCV